MKRRHFTPEEKSKIVLGLLREEKTSSEIAQAYQIHDTLQRAFKKAIPEIINSDQGSQFTSNEYIDLLKENHVRISMDSKERATDNAITERFFRNIKQEKLYIFEYNTPRELKNLINEYIHFYNFERPHQSLDYEYPYKLYTAA